MAASVDEKWSIDKLDGSNWTTWKFQMRHLLLAKDFWGHVDGTDVLAEDASPQVQADFQRKSQKVFSTIVMAITSSQLYLITSCEGPREAWEALRNHFERDTLANKLFLKKQYFRTEMKEGTPVETHLKHMKEITDKLAAIGAPISEEDQVVTLFGSLPSSYSILVTALEARVDGVTLNFVQQALRHEEQKQTESFKSSNGGLSSSHVDTALIGTQRKPIRPRSVVKCFGCSQTGHILRNCPRRKSSSTGPEHVASTVEEKCSDDYEDNGVFSAMSDADLKLMSCSWLVDSGASAHMTRDLRLLIGFQEFKIPQKVGLGDGSTVEAVGVGNVNVNMKFEGLDKQATLYNVLYVPKLTHNLFSVQAAASKGNTVQFSRTQCLIWDETGKVRGMGSLMGKLYQLNCEPVVIEHVSVASCENNINVWHQRLGHINE